MDRSTLIELFRQIWEGDDIPPPESLLRNVKQETAAIKLRWMPYSILTNLEHADFWQRIWLGKLKGIREESFTKDWKVPPDSDWPAVKARFLENLREAMRIAASEPFEHKMKSEEIAVRTLLQLAIHSSYHLGQVNLLKRELRLHAKQPDED